MADYRRMYITMIDASKRAIAALNEGDLLGAKAILEQAEQKCEDIFVETGE